MWANSFVNQPPLLRAVYDFLFLLRLDSAKQGERAGRNSIWIRRPGQFQASGLKKSGSIWFLFPKNLSLMQVN